MRNLLRFKILLITLFLLVLTLPVEATKGSLTIDTNVSNLTFTAFSLLHDVPGAFDKWQGEVHYNAAKPLKSSVTVSIEAASINTNNEGRDDHLRKKGFFDVEQHPAISFQSKSLVPMEEQTDWYQVTGDLQIKGITREVTFPAEIKKDNGTISATAKMTVNRRDFGITYRAFLNPIKNDVDIRFAIVAK